MTGRFMRLARMLSPMSAHAHKSVIWTQDADFQGIKGAKYIEKKKK